MEPHTSSIISGWNRANRDLRNAVSMFIALRQPGRIKKKRGANGPIRSRPALANEAFAVSAVTLATSFSL
jgi:hypothetical protein